MFINGLMKGMVRFMQSMIRFSLFGNYEKFSTSNLDYYLKLIDYFGKRGLETSSYYLDSIDRQQQMNYNCNQMAKLECLLCLFF